MNRLEINYCLLPEQLVSMSAPLLLFVMSKSVLCAYMLIYYIQTNEMKACITSQIYKKNQAGNISIMSHQNHKTFFGNAKTKFISQWPTHSETKLVGDPDYRSIILFIHVFLIQK